MTTSFSIDPKQNTPSTVPSSGGSTLKQETPGGTVTTAVESDPVKSSPSIDGSTHNPNTLGDFARYVSKIADYIRNNVTEVANFLAKWYATSLFYGIVATVIVYFVTTTLTIIVRLSEHTGGLGMDIAIVVGIASYAMGGIIPISSSFMVGQVLRLIDVDVSTSDSERDSDPTEDKNFPKDITKLDGTSMVWQLYPNEVDARLDLGNDFDLDIIFFHGLQLKHFKAAFWKTWLAAETKVPETKKHVVKDTEKDVVKGASGEAFWETWLATLVGWLARKTKASETKEDTVVWPKDWLATRLAEKASIKARMLSISYNTLALESDEQINLDTLAKNLVLDIITHRTHRIGQDRPVVLVGHSLGGVIIKKLMLSAWAESNNPADQNQPLIKQFVENVKGVFYYGTPHGGSRLADIAAYLPPLGPMVELLKTLGSETTVINEDFRRLVQHRQIQTSGVGEGSEIFNLTMPFNIWKFGIKVVEEASSELYSDDYRVAALADHFNVCRPKHQSFDASFYKLYDFIMEAIERYKKEQSISKVYRI